MKVSSPDNVIYYNGNRYSSFQELHKSSSMRGAKRVITFCIMTTVLPTVLIIIPLYLRHIVFADVTYTVAESDVVEITEGISTVFCSAHSLQMNSSFNAFQLNQIPRVSTKRKHIRLKKSMTLPDDTLEYWGFYLLKGATVLLKVCSRYEGSRILVVRGERNLRTCGLMEHNLKKFGATLDQEHNQVKVTFESAQEIEDANSSRGLNRQVNNPETETSSITNAALEDNADDGEVNLMSQIELSRIIRVNQSTEKSRENLSLNVSTPHEKKRKAKVLVKSPSGKHNKNGKHKHHNRHIHKKFLEKQRELYRLQQELQADEDIKLVVDRPKRNSPHLFDTKIEHGGNALNYSDVISNENSFSSFETDLLTCYNGQILLTEGFPPSHLCTDVHYLEKGDRMETVHNVVSDGYYYYIFYSDNDFISNDIHAIFDIYKPTLKFANISQSKACVNKTECKFPVPFWSDETVIVEVPMRDGIEHEDDDITFLISTCHPRMSVYIIFPVAVMFLILGCAFM